jgi:hypothetical protein
MSVLQLVYCYLRMEVIEYRLNVTTHLMIQVFIITQVPALALPNADDLSAPSQEGLALLARLGSYCFHFVRSITS